MTVTDGVEMGIEAAAAKALEVLKFIQLVAERPLTGIEVVECAPVTCRNAGPDSAIAVSNRHAATGRNRHETVADASRRRCCCAPVCRSGINMPLGHR
jgi:hypothetical protein